MSEAGYRAPVRLEGRFVVLEPLSLEHVADLTAASAGDEELWRWMPASTPRDENDMAAVVGAALTAQERGERVPWAVRSLADGVVVGCTSFLDIAPPDRRVEIGWTWYGRRWWRTAVNTETKLLLMTRAFDLLGANRVALKTDGANARSQAAIGRLGAQREGTLRQHVVRPDGSLRDTVYFSVLAAEWPGVRTNLESALRR